MKKTFFASFAVISVFILGGCGKNCRDASCPNIAPAFFAFRITNAAKKDLLTGPAKVYDSSQLLISARRFNSSALEPVTRVFSYSGDTLALAGFNVRETYSVYYLKLNGITTDSFFFRYNKNATACCDLSNFTFNQFNTTSVTPVQLPATFGVIK
ncbi:MAG: hypothetical protein K2X48_12160 [Chitinophagaceae bacterium]|nr:hypothetical protein [Chitinophagaceae bacterium]